MNVRIGLACALASIGALGVVALYAGAQPPAADPQPSPLTRKGTVIIQRQSPDGTIVEERVEEREERIDGKVLRTIPGRQPNVAAGFVQVPVTSADGKTYYAYAAQPAADAESIKMAADEQVAAQEARALAAQIAQADSDSAKADAKTKLRDKLVAIFDLQQKRRAHEIAKIEERLGKLKDTMKKRDTNKDPIIDRRLEQLTGGVDELGWEETGRYSVDPNAYPPTGYGYPGLSPQPQFTEPVKPVPSLPGAGAAPGASPTAPRFPGATPSVLPSPVPVPPPTEPRR
jgi:hypothetical protein